MRGTVYYRESDKRWVGSIDLGRDPETGKRKRKIIYADSEKEAEIKINNLIYEIQNNEFIEPSKITVENYLNIWFAIHKENIAETTSQYYSLMLSKHIIPKIGHYKLSEIKPMDLDKFYNSKKKKHSKDKKGLSGNSIFKIHCLIHMAFEYAKDNNYIKKNPAKKANPPKKSKYKPQIINEENFIKLLNSVKGTFDEVAILLAGCVGLRRGEVFGLRWKDIDWEKQVISIEETKTRFSTEVIKDTKNESSTRKFYIPKFVLDTLKQYQKSKGRKTGYICTEFKPQYYSKHFKLILEKNNLEKIRFHDLRHFNATIMMKYGIPDKIAAGRLGHSQVSTTREIYQHVLPSMDKEAAEIINDVFMNKQ